CTVVILVLLFFPTRRSSDLNAVSSGGGWFDIFDIHGGKGSAIQALQEKYNAKPEETMVFGDSQNDASMVEHAKYSVALSNADDRSEEHTSELQSRFDLVCRL